MTSVANQDETHMTTPEIIATHDYIPETHNIWTEDGYCLNVHRVLPKSTHEHSHDINKNETILNDNSTKHENYDIHNVNKRVPILIHHGLLSSSADWVLLGPGKALAYLLCDNGYDVWLGNARGNAYSRKHKEYTTRDREFWNFSWHEIGYYDLPTTIDYILEHTGHTELYYVGYSQGTTAFYIMASEKPEYNRKIKGMVSLAPVAFLSNQRSPLLKLIVHFYGLMEWGSSYCNVHQWFPRNRLQARALGTLIRNAPDSLTKGHFPAGASAKQIIHYSQSILSGSFRKFDYGAQENLKIYGSTQPPSYDLEKIKVPVAIFYSDNDFLTDPADVKKLTDRLPNVIGTRKISCPKFNHVDYLWGKDVKSLIYNPLLAVLKKF